MKIIAYHGGNLDKGIHKGQLYFTDDVHTAKLYGRENNPNYKIYKCELTFNNPLILNDEEYDEYMQQMNGWEQPIKEGYDSIICEENPEFNDPYYYVALKPTEQVKILDVQTVNETFNDSFWKWFKGSKIVDETGNPLICYHGSPSKFSMFDKSLAGKNSFHASGGIGFWFSTDKSFINEYPNQMSVYLSIKNPKIYTSGIVTDKELSLEYEEYENSSDDDKYYMQKTINDLKQRTDAYDHFLFDFYHINGLVPFYRNTYGDLNDYTYIKNNQPLIDNFVKTLKTDGYDGIIIKDTKYDYSSSRGTKNTQIVAFDAYQIKSVDNNGEWSESENIYETFEKLQDGINMFGEDETVYATKSDYDILNLLKNKPEFYRFIWDSKSGYYIISNGDTCIHADLGVIGYNKAVLESPFVKEGVVGSLTFWQYENEDESRISDGCNYKYKYPFGFIYTKFDMALEEMPLYKTLGKPLEKTELFDNKNIYESLNKVLEDFINKTGMPYYDDILDKPEYYAKKGRYIGKINMSPKGYISACVLGFKHNGSNTNYQDLYNSRAVDREDIEKLKDIIQNGKMDSPVLHYEIESDDKYYFDQEGLHRAIAAEELGIENIPVYICVVRDRDAEDYVDEHYLLKRLSQYINLYNKKQLAHSFAEELDNKFYKWFRDSKVVDENGKPLICFHGSNTDIKEFDISYSGKNTGLDNQALFFTTNKESAKAYSAYSQDIETENDYKTFNNEKLNPCYLRIENPYTYDAKGKELLSEKIYTLIWAVKGLNPNLADKEEFDSEFYNEIKNTVKDNYDGIIIKNVKDFPNYSLFNGIQDDYIVFNDTQVKPISELNETIAYHGSNNLFKAFKKDYIGTATEKEETDYHKSAQHGFFFTTDKKYADNYGKYLYTCELTINNPLIVDMSDYMATDEVLNNFINQAKKEGKDGVIFQNIREVGRPMATEYFVFEPEQIKIENTFEKLNEILERYL